MRRTRYDTFLALYREHGYVTNAMLQEAGVKSAASFTSKLAAENPPRIRATNHTQPYKYAPVTQAGTPATPNIPEPDAEGLALAADLDALMNGAVDDATVTTTPSAPHPDLLGKLDLDSIIAQLADTIAARIAEQVQARLTDYLTQVVPEQIGVVTAAPEPVPEHVPCRGDKLHVCIAGLLPQQEQMIKNEFGRDMKLSFIPSNSNPKGARGLLDHADAAFIMTKFVGHWLDKIVADAKVPVFRRVNGGMSMLRDSLTSVFCAS